MFAKVATTLFTLLVAACATSEPTADRGTAEPLVISSAPAPTPVAGDWRTRIRAHVAELRTTNPTLHAELAQLAPAQTRAGFLRFTASAIRDPHAAAVFLDRLVNGGEREEVRAALVEALPRTGGLYADAVGELIATEPAASVRAAYVHSVKRAPAAEALPVLERGLADADPRVSTEAAHAVASHPDGIKLAAALRAALANPEVSTRTAAARALGVLRVTAAQPELLRLLTDPAADLRLESLRALERIAPGSMKGHATVAAMTVDPDPRIAQLVARITGRATTATTAP